MNSINISPVAGTSLMTDPTVLGSLALPSSPTAVLSGVGATSSLALSAGKTAYLTCDLVKSPPASAPAALTHLVEWTANGSTWQAIDPVTYNYTMDLTTRLAGTGATAVRVRAVTWASGVLNVFLVQQ